MNRRPKTLWERNGGPSFDGRCPYCAGAGELVNVERSHYIVCRKHRAAWFVGANLYSCWRHETEEKWAKNKKLLRSCKFVDPIFVVYDLADPLKGPEDLARERREAEESKDASKMNQGMAVQ